MKHFKKLLISLLALIICLSSIACGAPGGGGGGGGAWTDPNATEYLRPVNGTTIINVMNFGGGVGRKWLDAAGAKFMELKSDEVYKAGTTGVSFNVTSTTSTDTATMNSSANHIYFDQSLSNLNSYITKGWFLDISDIVDDVVDTRNGQDVTILDKIQDDMEFSLKGNDGNYYALPHYTWFPGLTYDVSLFDQNGFYFADPASVDNYYEHEVSVLGETFKFVDGADAVKSVGNDGVPGTKDDGLPTSLMEFVALCDYMYNGLGIKPLTVAGGHIDYYSYLVGGLWATMSGYAQMRANYTFDGTIDIVNGFTDQELFIGTGIMKPNVETVSIDSVEDGWQTTKSVYRYYAAAFTELAVDQKWFSEDAASASHADTQNNFLYNGRYGKDSYAMLIEGSYWYNEIVDSGRLGQYYQRTGTTSREIAWMALPTSFDQTVTQGNGRESAFIEFGNSYAFINAKVANEDEGLVRACKDFLKFLYTDAQLKDFTKYSGSIKAKVDYDVQLSDLEGLSTFQQDLILAVQNGRIVYQAADNAKASGRMLDCNSAILKHGVYSDYYTAVVKGGATAKQIFNAKIIESTAWN